MDVKDWINYRLTRKNTSSWKKPEPSILCRHEECTYSFTWSGGRQTMCMLRYTVNYNITIISQSSFVPAYICALWHVKLLCYNAKQRC